MNFNVYLDALTVERLNALARRLGTTRNALIRQAVDQLLESKARPAWPDAVMAFEGDPSAPVFEAGRKRLRAPRRDPLR